MTPPSLLADIRCFVLDMDGTVYLGERLLPGARELLALFEVRGLDYLFLTNNSSRSRGQYAAKFVRLGLDVPESHIFTSGEGTVLTLRQDFAVQHVYVVGTPALEAEFVQAGYTLDPVKPEVVVLGFDTGLTYDKLWRLCDLVRAGLPYIATHPDFNCPIEGGTMPDIGATIAFVQASTGRLPDIVVGKPNPPIVRSLTARTGLTPGQMCMVGDRLYTDIALGQTGMLTALVLSGETRREDIPTAPHPPDIVVEDLAGLVGLLRGA
ncbi:MAG: HAD-IIA family hydrolase [Anaerolineae bacterium]|nr:HAD-IIA family hydrolase [Anaerolineae bacterium]